MLYAFTVLLCESRTPTPHRSHPMLDHMTFRVTDIQRAKAFYSAVLVS